MQSLASKEETQTVEMRSAEFDPEYGSRPGAQIKITIRGGSEDFHGAIFGYFRPHSLDSMDWFARGAATIADGIAQWLGRRLWGGPLWRKRTFFFAALEQRTSTIARCR